jgi:hypothetical protein
MTYHSKILVLNPVVDSHPCRVVLSKIQLSDVSIKDPHEGQSDDGGGMSNSVQVGRVPTGGPGVVPLNTTEYLLRQLVVMFCAVATST